MLLFGRDALHVLQFDFALRKEGAGVLSKASCQFGVNSSEYCCSLLVEPVEITQSCSSHPQGRCSRTLRPDSCCCCSFVSSRLFRKHRPTRSTALRHSTRGSTLTSVS